MNIEAQRLMLQEILLAICSRPTDVRIRNSDRTMSVTVSTTDVGRVLGKSARLFQSLRRLVEFTGHATLAPILEHDQTIADLLPSFAPDNLWNRDAMVRVCKLIDSATGIQVEFTGSIGPCGEVFVGACSRQMMDSITLVLQAVGMALGASIVTISDEGRATGG